MIKKNYKNAVVIITYKDCPSDSERASFAQCLRVMKKHKIYVVHPCKIDLNEYIKVSQSAGVEFFPISFDDAYFANVKSYNNLMLTSYFYDTFTTHDYILIYQLDAWIFKDELDFWCEKGYSYIGAPWFEGFSAANEDSIMLENSGNGGFSLRHVKSFIELLNMRLTLRHFAVGKKISRKSYCSFLWSFLKQRPLITEVFSMTLYNEDWLYANYANMIYKAFKVAPASIALSFSFEVNPKVLYVKNNYELPFGCHAFERYDPEFWQDKIDFSNFKK